MASFQGTTTGSPAIEVLKQQLQESDSKIREGQRAPNKLNPNRHAARPILINRPKVNRKGGGQRQQENSKAFMMREPQ